MGAGPGLCAGFGHWVEVLALGAEAGKSRVKKLEEESEWRRWARTLGDDEVGSDERRVPKARTDSDLQTCHSHALRDLHIYRF